MQRDDFAGIFRRMKGCPVTIRTLDPPLHEFLPHDAEDAGARLAQQAGHQPGREGRRARRASLHEANPMLGLRGCRLGIIYPEITEMQARAIIRGGLQRAQGRHSR